MNYPKTQICPNEHTATHQGEGRYLCQECLATFGFPWNAIQAVSYLDSEGLGECDSLKAVYVLIQGYRRLEEALKECEATLRAVREDRFKQIYALKEARQVNENLSARNSYLETVLNTVRDNQKKAVEGMRDALQAVEGLKKRNTLVFRVYQNLPGTVRYIEGRTGFSKRQIRTATAYLWHKGLVERDEEGCWKRVKTPVLSPEVHKQAKDLLGY